ncbi:M57 family metalloprotease [Ekhidna sp.]|uniref:M57 family metalloprotease n=1 Tax=Ekhidna sp. TaxID=2608089 RepID=UPI003BAD3BBD
MKNFAFKVLNALPTVAITALFITIITSCNTDHDYIFLEEPKDLLSASPEIFDYLSCQDFDLTNAKLYDEHVLIQEDIAIRLDVILKNIEEAKQSSSGGRTSQFVVNTGSVVSFNNVMNIYYHINSSVETIPGNWKAAIRAAIQDWEDLPSCRISFNEITKAKAADLTFYASNTSSTNLSSCAKDFSSGAHARAEYPGGGQPGRWIVINSNPTSQTQGHRESVIRHELGHTLGFRHDNPFSYVEPVNYSGCGNMVLGANRLVGTPINDDTSIMTRSIPNNETRHLSSDDAKASTYLYPAGYTAPKISTVTQTYRTSYSKDVEITMSNPSVRMYRYRVERLAPWSSQVYQSAEYTTTSNTFLLSNVPHGTWNFRITSLNYARDASMTGISKMMTIQ